MKKMLRKYFDNEQLIIMTANSNEKIQYFRVTEKKLWKHNTQTTMMSSFQSVLHSRNVMIIDVLKQCCFSSSVLPDTKLELFCCAQVTLILLCKNPRITVLMCFSGDVFTKNLLDYSKLIALPDKGEYL